MAGTRSLRLSAYAAALVVTIGIVQLIASVSFYRAIDAQTLREDHARRVAELLVVGERVFHRDPALTPSIMTSSHLEVAVSSTPVVTATAPTPELRALSRQIVRWEPRLAGKPIHLAIVRGEQGRRDFVGSMRLTGGQWLNFESRDISSMWPIALRATWMTAVTGLLCLIGALALLRVLTRPLRRLSDAAAAIGHGQRVVVRENGPTDLRNLAHAMNEMQERIALLLEDQAKSFEAISHDLRTPLARQKVAAELIDDDEMAAVVVENIDEMGALLDSLQQFLRAQHLRADPEVVDLGELLRGLIAPLDCRIALTCPTAAQVHSYREPLLLALRPLLENACRYGQTADVSVKRDGADWFIEIADDGPGIPAQHFADVLTPFFRLDAARGRTTKGFGLGIPTAHRLLTRFGGKLTFGNGISDGLHVCVQVPAAD